MTADGALENEIPDDKVKGFDTRIRIVGLNSLFTLPSGSNSGRLVHSVHHKGKIVDIE